VRPNTPATLLLATLLAATPAHAKNTPKPTPEAELKQTAKEMQEAQSDQTRIKTETQAIEIELAALQSQLIKRAAIAQKSESDLSTAEEKLGILNTQLTAKDKEFKTRQTHLSGLVQASISISHTPPEAMVMMPGDVTRTMKAARALKMASEAVKAETLSLGLQMAELQKFKDKVARERNDLVSRQKELESQQKDLLAKLSERKNLQKRLGLQAKETQSRLTILAKKTADLEQLVEKVEEDRKAEADEATNQKKRASSHSFAEAKGRIRVPVSGKLTQKFGNSEGKNTTSKGITLETRKHASVIAPFDGEVVFTGPFLKYGKMVIIHHSDNFHTLLAGLEKIDVDVGQFLLEGEPIGAMGDDADEQELYVELRKDNQPIDPAPWMSALKRK